MNPQVLKAKQIEYEEDASLQDIGFRPFSLVLQEGNGTGEVNTERKEHQAIYGEFPGNVGEEPEGEEKGGGRCVGIGENGEGGEVGGEGKGGGMLGGENGETFRKEMGSAGGEAGVGRGDRCTPPLCHTPPAQAPAQRKPIPRRRPYKDPLAEERLARNLAHPQGTPGRPPARLALTLKDVRRALMASGGLKTTAARFLGVQPSSLVKWFEKYPKLNEYLKEAEEGRVDRSEEALFTLIDKASPSIAAIQTHLAARAKRRGYGQSNVVHSGDPLNPVRITITPYIPGVTVVDKFKALTETPLQAMASQLKEGVGRVSQDNDRVPVKEIVLEKHEQVFQERDRVPGTVSPAPDGEGGGVGTILLNPEEENEEGEGERLELEEEDLL